MDEAVKYLLLSIVTPAGVAWLVSILTAKHRLREELARGMIRAEIEEGLAKIKADFDQKQEKLRHDLHREAVVHEIKFRKLYDKVSTVVTVTFRLLTKTYLSGMEFIQAVGIKEDLRKTAYSGFAEDF